MGAALPVGIGEVLHAAYRPYRALPELLCALMRSLVLRARLLGASVRLPGIGHALAQRNGEELNTDWLAEAGTAAAAWCPTAREPTPVPVSGAGGEVARGIAVSYAAQTLGELNVAWRSDSPLDPERHRLCEALARWCAVFVKRHGLQQWAAQRLGHPWLVVGTSPALHELERFVEKAVQSALPVLLRGEFGTEKALFAAAIHCGSARCDGPFIEVTCAEPVGEPAAWFDRARGGTLYFNEVEELPRAVQQQLPQHLHSRLGQWLGSGPAADVRVIASCTHDLHRRAHEGSFSKVLLAELDFLHATVPPLRVRSGDMAALVSASLLRHGFQPEQTLSDEFLALCSAHPWPENLFELERVVARLAVMCEGRRIGRADVQLHAPDLMGAADGGALRSDRRADPWGAETPSEHMAAFTPDTTTDTTTDTTVDTTPDSTPDTGSDSCTLGDDDRTDDWVQCLLAHDTARLDRLHAALRRALLYMSQHYAQPLSLGELAAHAHVSPSHLSYLFRSSLHSAFKPLLQRLRIEKAKQLLASGPGQRITEVALSVGFADLSHFEKSFRRVVGQAPRDFRRSQGLP